MTALAAERPRTMPDIATQAENAPFDEGLSELEKVVWQAWKAMELPEGYHAEIIEGAIEVSPTGRFSHGQIINLLRDELVFFLKETDFVARNDINVVHKGSAWVPDLFIVPRDVDRFVTADGLGITAAAVRLVVEVVSPGKRNQDRDRVRKRREYARAGIPVYVIIDDHDAQGTVTVLTEPRSDKGDWVGVHQVPYGTEVIIPEGPAKGFTLDEAITGARRP
ncbi:Uma2 family endonuclease [Streptomyces sp. NPDC046821]|uniref:Uma2 family endonuclease n=1 Tax=Streptomyces sp. NPDC046821 TaxID=3154702 RepID=UPI0033CC0775